MKDISLVPPFLIKKIRALSARAASNPLHLFGFFLFSNISLSYFPFSAGAKTALFVLGILIPWLFGLFGELRKPPSKELLQGKNLSLSVPPILWVLLLGLCVFFRFYKLTSLSVWPLNDEGIISSPAIDLSEKWKWAFFYGLNYYPPLNYWLLGLFFRLLSPSLFSLWLYPALLSLLQLALCFLAVRPLLPRFPFLVFTGFSCMSFWMIYEARFCSSYMILSVWEFLVFSAALLTIRKHPASPPFFSVVILGVLVGLGFYTYTSWPVVALLVCLLLGLQYRRSFWSVLTPFLLSILVLAAPLAWALLNNPASYAYLQSVRLSSGFLEPTHLADCLYSVANVFWTGQNHLAGFGPYWGGFLNPLMDSFFFLGILHLIRCRRSSAARFLLFSIPFYWLPAFFAQGVEMFRVVHALPLVLAVAAFGFHFLTKEFSKGWAWAAFGFFFLLSTGLDLYHLLVPYQKAWSDPANWQYKRMEGFRAYQLLKPKADSEGPGYVLAEMGGLAADSAFRTACYSFDCQRNPGLRGNTAHWAVLLTDANLEPLLRKRLPGAQWRWLSSDLRRSDGGVLMGFIPLRGNVPATLSNWVEMDRALHCLNWMDGLQENPAPDGQKELCRKEILSLAQKDPFLRDCFWEKKVLESLRLEPGKASTVIRQALAQGCSSAYFDFELGNQLFKEGEKAEAQTAYQKAVQKAGNRTMASLFLQNIKQGN